MSNIRINQYNKQPSTTNKPIPQINAPFHFLSTDELVNKKAKYKNQINITLKTKENKERKGALS
ncbi:MAG TPA: hypothetical protein DIW64_01995 [Cellvibrio sp.]|nr:hypothetical protein [Cellvibrio sp.]